MSKSIIKQKRILTKAGGGSSLATPVSVANGGTGLTSYAIGDIIYASGATTLSKLADVATGNALISGGVGTAPSWGKIGLTTHITGGNWKTIYTNGSGVVTELALGSSGQVLQSNGASSAPTWVTPSSGITVGGTAITAGADYRVLFQDATASDFVTQIANFTMGAVASGFLDVPTGYALAGHQLIKEVNTSSLVIGNTSAASMTGNTNTVLGYGSGAITNGTNNTIVGYGNCTNSANNAASYNTVLGNGCDLRSSTGYITAIGYNAGSLHSGYYSIHIGLSAGSAGGATVGNINIGAYAGESTNYSSSICIGANAQATATNQLILGGRNSHGVDGTITAIYLGNGVTLTSPSSVTLNATGGSGANNTGASLTIAAGKSTGNATPAVINFQSTAAGASSSTAQTLATVLQITNSTTITTSDAVNYALGSTTGTKFGTTNTQKLAFWNATPIVQPSGATQAAPAAYATGAFGLDSDANMQALYDLVVAMRTALVNVGIMKGSA